jgi:predicted RNA-binding Zn-ribbon protein involved in translation (DUF1610 family)
MKKYSNLVNDIIKARQQDNASQGAVKYQDQPQKKKYDTYGGEVKLVLDVEQDKCPNCGASLVFDPKTQKLYCDYCDNSFEIASKRSSEIVLDFSLDKQKKWNDETKVSHCDSCGAEFVFDKDEFAKKCPFCDSPSVTRVEDLEGIRPNAVVPFKITQAQAKECYQRWIKRRIFAPTAFRKQHAVEYFKGVYSPSWTFDTKTFSSYTGVVGDYYYVTVGSGKNRRVERRIRYRNVSGNYEAIFDDININSSRQINDRYFNKLKPFNTNDSVEYRRQYLAGYTAEHYHKSLGNGWSEALNVINNTIRSCIIASLHCDVVSHLNIVTQYRDKTFKYVLLPIYIANHFYKQKQYFTYINGSTGKAVGKAPLSAPKLVSFILGILGGIALIAFLLNFLQII